MATEPTATNIGGFRDLRVVIQEQQLGALQFEWLNTDLNTWNGPLGIGWDPGYVLDTATPYAQLFLDRLQALWAAGTITASDITLLKPGPAYSFAQFVREWGPNPLVPGSVEAWINRHDVANRLGADAALSEAGLTVRAQLQTAAKSTAGGTVDLRPWTLTEYDDEFHLYLAVSDYPEIVTKTSPLPAGQTALAAFTPVAAMVAWLNSVRNTNLGDAVPGDLSSTAGRQFQPAFSGGGYFTIDDPPAVLSVNGRVTAINMVIPIRQVATTDGPVDSPTYENLARYLGAEVTVPAGTTVMVPNKTGSADSPVEAAELVLAPTVRLAARNRSPVVTVRDTDSDVDWHVQLGSHRVVDHATLPAVSGEAYRWMPTPRERPQVGAVHHYGDAATLRLRTPQELCEHTGVERTIYVLNDGTGRYTLRDWDNAEIAQLRAGETAVLRLLWDRTGTGHLFGQVAERYHSLSNGDDGTLTPGRVANQGTNWRVIQPKTSFNTGGDRSDHLDADAFRIGTETWSTGADWAPSSLKTAETLEVLKAGTLDFEQYVEIEATPQGTLGSHRPVLQRRRSGSTALGVLDTDWHAGLTHGDHRVYRWRYRGRVEAGDLLVPNILYPAAATLVLGSCAIRESQRTATLRQDIGKSTA